jgi:hypothetical protein
MALPVPKSEKKQSHGTNSKTTYQRLFLSCFILMLCCLGMWAGGCFKEANEQKATLAPESGPANSQSQKQGSRSSLSAVTHAEIVAANPISEKPLIIQYESNNPGGRPFIYYFRWYIDGRLLPDAASDTLEPGYFHKGDRVEAEVIATLEETEGTAYRTAAVMVKNTPPVVTAVELSPALAYPGDRITATSAGSDWDRDVITYLYQWEVNGKIISGADKAEFDTSGLKKKSIITVTVTPFDGEDRGNPVRSAKPVILSNRLPEITSNPPSGLNNGVYIYQVTATDPDGDPLAYNLVTAPQGMTIDRSTGLIRWELPKEVTGKQDQTVKVTVDDGDGGIVYQEFSLFLEMK